MEEPMCEECNVNPLEGFCMETNKWNCAKCFFGNHIDNKSSNSKSDKSEEMIEMKKSDYDKLIAELSELKDYVYYLNNYTETWAEHKVTQEELKQAYLNPNKSS